MDRMDLDLLERTLADTGQPAFRARQVWDWTARGAGGYEAMTNLPVALRDELAERVPFSTLTVADEAQSCDGTMKTLFHTHDGRAVEAVLMRYPPPRGRAALAVRLLAVGLPADLHVLRDGRNEVRAQPHGVGDPRPGAALPPHRGRRSSGLHGHGRADDEPLRRAGASRRLPDLGITHRRTTVSTVGWIPGIDRLAQSDMPLRLAFSLHAPDDALRSQIMPVNERYPLADVLAACRRWHVAKRRPVFIEYVMLAGVNDRYEQAVALSRLLDRKGLQGQPYPLQPERLARQRLEPGRRSTAFRAALEEHGVRVTVRLTRGRDIAAACGQLAAAAASG